MGLFDSGQQYRRDLLKRQMATLPQGQTKADKIARGLAQMGIALFAQPDAATDPQLRKLEQIELLKKGALSPQQVAYDDPTETSQPSDLYGRYGNLVRDLSEKGYIEEAVQAKKTQDLFADKQTEIVSKQFAPWRAVHKDDQTSYIVYPSHDPSRRKVTTVTGEDVTDTVDASKLEYATGQGVGFDYSSTVKLANEMSAASFKEDAKDIRTVGKNALADKDAASKQVAYLTRMNQLLDQGTRTGFGQEFWVEVRKIGDLIGIPADVANEEQFRSLTMQSVMGWIAQTKGAISEKEMNAFNKASANLANTPEGNKLIIEFGLHAAKRAKDKALRYSRFMDITPRDKQTVGNWILFNEQQLTRRDKAENKQWEKRFEEVAKAQPFKFTVENPDDKINQILQGYK